MIPRKNTSEKLTSGCIPVKFQIKKPSKRAYERG